MIDRHAVQQMLTAGGRIGEVARYFEVSRRTIERIRKEPAVEGAEDAVARWKRGVGRPPVPATVRERMRPLIAEDPEEAPLEVLRRLREERHRLGESTFPAALGGAGGAIQGPDGALRGGGRGFQRLWYIRQPEWGIRQDALGVHALGRVEYEVRDGEVVYMDGGRYGSW